MESAHRNGIKLDKPIAQPQPFSPLDDRVGSDFVSLMRKLGEQMQDGFFGLASSPLPCDAPEFGFEIMMLSDTLGEALDRYFRFYRMVTNGLLLALDSGRKSASIVITATDPARDEHCFLIEWYTARLLGFSQWLTGNELLETRVEFAHERRLPAPAYTASLGEHVAFGQASNRIIMPIRYLGMRVVRTAQDIGTIKAKAKFDPEHRAIKRRRWSSLLKSILRDALVKQQAFPSMEEVARGLGVSSQTLRRNIQSESLSYRIIKAEARQEVVLASLGDPSMTIRELYKLAGFADANGLFRAVKSWTGMTFTDYRQLVLANGDQQGISAAPPATPQIAQPAHPRRHDAG
jgi:AraC-like DNA-binding protein